MKKTIIILCLFFIKLGYAQDKDLALECKDQKEFKFNYEYKAGHLKIKIERLDKKPIQYYTLPNTKDSFIGFKFNNKSILINQLGTRQFFGGPSYDPGLEEENRSPYIKEYSKLMNGNYQRLSPYLLLRQVSIRYKLPLITPTTEKVFERDIVLEKFMEDYQVIFTENNIQGLQKIKFYTIFLHSQVPKLSCSYFESPEIEYYFK